MMDSLRKHSHPIQWSLFAILLFAFLFINFPFLTPMILAGIFALGLNDFVDKMSKRLKMKRNWLVILLMILGLALFWIPITLAVYRVISHVSQPEAFQTSSLVNQAHAVKDFAITNLQKITQWTGVDVATPAQGLMESLLQKVGAFVLQYSTTFLSQLPEVLLAVFVFIITLLVLLLNAQSARDFCMKYSPLRSDLMVSIIKISKTSCEITIFSTLIIGIIQAAVIGIGSLIFGEGDFWLVITVTFFVSFIPVIGAAPVGYLLSLIAFLKDRNGAAIGLFIVATFAGSIDNILKPFLVSGDLEIHPVIGFTSVVGAIFMMGLPGLIIGPVLMNLFVGLSPILLAKD